MNAEYFIKEISSLSFENAFNPYSERCEVYDYSDAPQRRRALLLKILNAASGMEVDSIWIGRDLGYRGGRRTGLALTDDVHFSHHAERWGIKVDRPTKGQAVPERTAAVIWSVLSLISSPVFLWNVFPLHPYEAGDPFTNRAHNVKERIAGEELLALLIEFLKPKRIIAIGNDAEKTANKIAGGLDVIKVRHPSYGGQSDFLRQTHEIYAIRMHKQAQLI
jgi:hypothetical protein